MMRLAEEVYRGSELPSQILSWDLIEGYYEKHFPDVLNRRDHRLLMNLLVDQMLLKGTDRIPESESGDKNLDELFDSETFETLIDDGILRNEKGYVRFPHERFTEIHLARRLIHKDTLSEEMIVKYIERANEFPLLWGALKLALMKEWNPDLIIGLVENEHAELNELLAATIFAVGREEEEKAIKIIEEINQFESLEAKRLALDVAYNLEQMDVLEKAVYELNDEK